MDQIKQTFAQCAAERRSALVTYVTAGFPTAHETVDILLGMEAGGAGLNPSEILVECLLTVAKTSLNSASPSQTR